MAALTLLLALALLSALTLLLALTLLTDFELFWLLPDFADFAGEEVEDSLGCLLGNKDTLGIADTDGSVEGLELGYQRQ